MADSCALARERLAKYVHGLQPAPMLQRVVSGIKTGMLGSVVTPLRALGGNALSVGYRTLVEHPVRTAADYMMAVAKSAREGKLSLSPDEYRQMKFALDADGFGKLWSGFKRGAEPTTEAIKSARSAFTDAPTTLDGVRNAVKAFSDELTTRLDAENVNRTLEYREVTYQNPMSTAIVRGVFGIMEAVDRPYWRASYDFSTYMQSRLFAAKEGLKGSALRERAKALFENPTDEMLARAVDDANYATFKNRNVLARLATRLKGGAQQMAEREPRAPKGSYQYGVERSQQKGAQGASYVLETNLPFTGVPSSIAGQAAALSTGPLSLVRLITNRNPAAVSRIVSDAALGSALMAYGYALARDGKLVGSAPPLGSAERGLFDAEGKQAWSVKIGDRWYELRFAVPVAAPLFAGYAMYEATQDEEGTPVDRALAGAGATAKMLTEQTYLTNVRGIIDALAAPERKMAGLVASQVPIPALSGQVARALDPVDRAPRTVPQRLANRIPGLSRTVPPVVDAFGREMRKDIPERLSQVFSPSRTSRATEDDLTREFRRLGVTLTVPGRTTTVRGQKIVRDGHEQADFLQQVGGEKEARLRELIASPEYRAAPDEMKAKMLDKIQGLATTRATQRAVRPLVDSLMRR